MSLSDHSLREPGFLPEAVEDLLRLWCFRLAGAGLAVLGVVGWLCLVTWDVPSADPLVGNGGNALGPLGSILADLLMQTLGLAAVLAFLPLMTFAREVFFFQRVRLLTARLVFWPIAIILLAGAFAAFPVPSQWPLQHGFGGLSGDFLYDTGRRIADTVEPRFGGLVVGLALWAAGLTVFFRALDVDPRALGMLLRFDDPLMPRFVRRVLSGRARRRADRQMVREAGRAEPYVGGGTAPGLPGAPNAQSEMFGGAAHYPQPQPGFGHAPVVPVQQAHAPNPADEMWPAERVEAVETGQPVEPMAMADRPAFLRDAAADMADDVWGEPDAGTVNAASASGFMADDGAPELSSRSLAARFAPRSSYANAGGTERKTTGEQAPAARDDDGDGRRRAAAPQNGDARRAAFLPTAGRRNGFRLPGLNLLIKDRSPRPGPARGESVLRGNARLLEDVLNDFGVKGTIRGVRPGPVVTLYELEPARGVKASRVIGLADDIARSMSAASARVAVIPGMNAIGIELPNVQREPVSLRALLDSPAFQRSDAKLPLAIGKAIDGTPVVTDLARMPHLLVAGTTGSGKSVGINAMILSLLFRHTPEQCRFLMIDPKMLELSVYNGIPHLLTPVVTDPAKAVAALNWAVREMEERYKRMSELGVRNMEVYNNRLANATKQGKVPGRTVQTGFDARTGEPIYETRKASREAMPHIVIVIDEMADLMMTAGRDFEAAVQRLAQMARAAGIHLVTATQRPSVDVITGTIKANLPTRMSFKVTTAGDSRTILGQHGAEQLLGAGDLLFSLGGGQISRLHGPFVSEDEIEAVVAHLSRQGAPNYIDGITDDVRDGDDEDGETGPVAGGTGSGTELYDKACAIVIRDERASTSYLQRRLSIGYNRAADLIDRMESEGLVSAPGSTGRRTVLA